MALLTTMPASTITPNSATTLTGVLVTAREMTTPARPRGTVNKMMKGCTRDSNCEAITR